MRSRRWAFAALAALGFVVAPAGAQSPAPAMNPMPRKVHATYSCHNLKVPVTYDNTKNVVRIAYGSRRYTLPHAMSADGSRYKNDKLEWWSKGTTATLSSVEGGKAETVLAHCVQIKGFRSATSVHASVARHTHACVNGSEIHQSLM